MATGPRRQAMLGLATVASVVVTSVCACGGPTPRVVAGRTVSAFEDEWAEFDRLHQHALGIASDRERCLFAVSGLQQTSAASEPPRTPAVPQPTDLLPEVHCAKYAALLQMQAEGLVIDTRSAAEELVKLRGALAEWIPPHDLSEWSTPSEVEELEKELKHHLAGPHRERSMAMLAPALQAIVNQLRDVEASVRTHRQELIRQLRSEAARLRQEEQACLKYNRSVIKHNRAVAKRRKEHAECTTQRSAWEHTNRSTFETFVSAARPLTQYEFILGWFGADPEDGLTEFEQQRWQEERETFRSSTLGKPLLSVTWIRPPTYSFDRSAFLLPYPAVLESSYCHDNHMYGDMSAWHAGLPVRPGPPDNYDDSKCPSNDRYGQLCDDNVVTTFVPPRTVTLRHGYSFDAVWSRFRVKRKLSIRLETADAEQVRATTGLVQIAVWRPVGDWQTTVLRKPVRGRPYYFASVCGVRAELVAVQIRHPISGAVLWSSVDPASAWSDSTSCPEPLILQKARKNLTAAGLAPSTVMPAGDQRGSDHDDRGGAVEGDDESEALRDCGPISESVARITKALAAIDD